MHEDFLERHDRPSLARASLVNLTDRSAESAAFLADSRDSGKVQGTKGQTSPKRALAKLAQELIVPDMRTPAKAGPATVIELERLELHCTSCLRRRRRGSRL